MSKIIDLPKHERPREKMIEKGAVGLRNGELLAILLRTGYTGKNVLEVAEGILRKFPMKKLLAMSYGDLVKIKGIDSGKACSMLAAFELTKRALEVEDNNLSVINTARDAMNQLQELRTAKKEHLIALYLNARNQLIHKETISIGTLNASLVHPREVYKPAIDYLAASIILAHNHPSGDVEASEDDMLITRRLIETGGVVGINISDCLIITKDNFQSYKNKYL
ncbi:MAG: DNA repair protein RadC [Patescibacteria group bacterium]|nr:DNA repair protein RadC [Patescibacteria group bacterium]